LNLGGNLSGDGFQNGGAIIVEKGGAKTLLTYVQKEAPDHVENEDVLKVVVGVVLLDRDQTATSTYSLLFLSMQALGMHLDPVPHAEDAK